MVKQLPMSTPALFCDQSENGDRCPDCLSMNIEGRYTSQNLLDRLSNQPPRSVDLYLDIQFNEQWYEVLGGRIKFGINGGELRLKIKGGKVSLDSRSLCSLLKLDVPIVRKKKATEKAKVGFKLGSREGDFSGEYEETNENTDEVEFTTCQVTTKGSDREPAWVFEEKQGEPVLKGLLKKTKLATLSMTEKPCIVLATFEVSSRDIQLTAFEGIVQIEIIPEKRATLDRYFAKLLLKKQMQPYLSQQELRYE